MTRMCHKLIRKTLDTIQCSAKRDECPKKINKCIVGARCWSVVRKE